MKEHEMNNREIIVARRNEAKKAIQENKERI